MGFFFILIAFQDIVIVKKTEKIMKIIFKEKKRHK